MRETNVVHLEARLREGIVSEEQRALRWDQTYGASAGGPSGYRVRHIWDPQALSKEAKLFPARGRQGFLPKPASLAWDPGSSASSGPNRAELRQQRKHEFASQEDTASTGGVTLKLDRPSFGPSEGRYNTRNSAGVIGQAAPYVVPQRPRYGRETWRLDAATECRNDATQLMFSRRTAGGLERGTASRLFG